MWTTFILAVLAAFAIGSSICESLPRPSFLPPNVPKKPPFSLQHYRIPRGTYDPSPYIFDGFPNSPPTTDHRYRFRTVFSDNEVDENRRSARSVTQRRRPQALELLPGYKQMKPRVARDLRLPGPDYEVPRVPHIPTSRFPWEEEAFDRRYPRIG